MLRHVLNFSSARGMTRPMFVHSRDRIGHAAGRRTARAGVIVVVLCLGWAFGVEARAADWPQFMRSAQRTGDASDEALEFPLGLVAQVRLDDAILTSPAVVSGRAYVVDQMGAAYCVDPDSSRILWKSSPDGDAAMGSNTSSPCVVNGRVYFGTTAGKLHILSAADGRVIRSVDLGWPVTAAPVHEGGRIYFQTVGAVLHCFDLDGNEIWIWDHYARYVDPKQAEWAKTWPGSYNSPHYAGNEIAVRDRRIVAGMGWDHFCLEDAGDEPRLVWCNRAALGKDDGIPLAPAIAGDYVYTAWPGVDAAGSLLRVKLEDGSFDRKSDQLGRTYWAIFGAPAVRGETAYFGRSTLGCTAYEFGARKTHWESFDRSRPDEFQAVVSSPALSRDHCLFTTIKGELIAVPLEARGSGLDRLEPAPFRFRTPHGKWIASSPAISNGRVYFGCDDGFLYVLGAGGKATPRQEKLTVHLRRTPAGSATGKRYDWPGPFGGPSNNNVVDDVELKPPFRVRWAVRAFASFKQPPSAVGDDLLFQSEEGTLACLEQATGRVRWRTRMSDALSGGLRMYSGVLCADGKVFANASQPRDSRFFCFDLETGELLWSRPTGQTFGSKSRASAVYASGRVAFGYTIGSDDDYRKAALAVVEAWDAETGETAWRVEMNAQGAIKRPTAASHGDTFYFTTTFGSTSKADRGETIAIDAKTGTVLWRADGVFGDGSILPVVHGDRLYVITRSDLVCLNRQTGETEWTDKRNDLWFHGIVIGDGYFTHRGYSGAAHKVSLEDRRPIMQNGRRIPLGAEAHTCAPVVLTSGDLSLAVSNVGLHARDANSGELLWVSKGFAPRICTAAIPANGRLFCNPQVTGTLFCFEPEQTGR